MRMWMLNPKILCRQHLLGEANELHKHLHNWQKKHKIDGRIAGNAIEPMSYKARHDELTEEMTRRGYNHKSPLEQPDFSYLSEEQRNIKVDKEAALNLLLDRCAECAKRYMEEINHV